MKVISLLIALRVRIHHQFDLSHRMCRGLSNCCPKFVSVEARGNVMVLSSDNFYIFIFWYCLSAGIWSFYSE